MKDQDDFFLTTKDTEVVTKDTKVQNLNSVILCVFLCVLSVKIRAYPRT